MNSRLLKNILQETIFRLLSQINKITPKNKNQILLYSNMEFRDNILDIYNYLIENNYNNNFKIIRSQKEKFIEKVPQNVFIVSNIKAIYYFLTSAHIFYCFGKLPIIPNKNQKVVQLWHGTPFKNNDDTQKKEFSRKRKKSYYTNILVSAPIFAGFWKNESEDTEKIITICGEAKTDLMNFPYKKEEIGLKNEKLILWTPTFKNSKILGYNDTEKENNIIPIIKTNDFQRLNDFLKEKNVKLIVKLHPFQDVDESYLSKYSNFIVYTDSEFKNKGYNLYRFLGTSDAIISDYSSIFLNYLMLNRPIGFTEDDFEDYQNHRGFYLSDTEHFRPGQKLKTIDDLFSFIENVSTGNDEYFEKRKQVNSEVNVYCDFQNRKRALEIGGVFAVSNQ